MLLSCRQKQLKTTRATKAATSRKQLAKAAKRQKQPTKSCQNRPNTAKNKRRQVKFSKSNLEKSFPKPSPNLVQILPTTPPEPSKIELLDPLGHLLGPLGPLLGSLELQGR